MAPSHYELLPRTEAGDADVDRVVRPSLPWFGRRRRLLPLLAASALLVVIGVGWTGAMDELAIARRKAPVGRWLLPVAILEQETKASLHLRNLMSVALSGVDLARSASAASC